MSMKNLKMLLAPWCDAPDISILGLTLDHRQLTQGEVFIAIQGYQFDARTVIADAIENGAVAILADAGEVDAHFSISYQNAIPVIAFPQLKSTLSQISARFYQIHALPVIGVTGTNGKTTITQLIAQWLNLLAKPTAVMGTTGNGFLNNLIAAENTTASALAIAQHLAAFKQQNAAYVAMEVSSHGLVQSRVKAVNFNAVVFSNLSRDHLDYHGTMEAYAQAKLRLFTEYGAPISVINADDAIGKSWLESMPNAIAVSLFPQTYQNMAQQNRQALWLTDVHYTQQGVNICFDSTWGSGEFSAALVGEFNVMNVLLSLSTLLAMGFDKHALLEVAPKLKAVIGRMEVFHDIDKPMLVVDYAHTPDALEKALRALRIHCFGKLWCVFGCGGDRDKGKRAIMADIAERYADKVILTNDNPRTEAPKQIIEDMLRGMKNPQNADIIYDRFDACLHAFSQAHSKDVILVAGKGHENYQIFVEGTVHYSDRETVQHLLEKL